MVIEAAPPFFVGLLLKLAFSVELGWLPIFGALPQATAANGRERSTQVLPARWSCEQIAPGRRWLT
jgi:ABC-type dipeptide/oligopeptide/nickel transport system permease component